MYGLPHKLGSLIEQIGLTILEWGLQFWSKVVNIPKLMLLFLTKDATLTKITRP